MKKRYTYGYVKTVTGRITVTASSDEDADRDARDFLEALNPDETMLSANDEPKDIEVGLLDLKEVEPDGPDRADEL